MEGSNLSNGKDLGSIAYALCAFLIYLSPLVSVVIRFLYFRKDRLPSSDDAAVVYGKDLKKLPKWPKSEGTTPVTLTNGW
jgi:hypothetical protein